MTEVTRVYVTLATASGAAAETDDHVYLGVCGTGGGREFALDVAGFDDWESGSKVAYGFGPGPRFSAPAGYSKKEPTTAADQLTNINISITDVTHVYLRKQGDRTQYGDDYWELEDCQVFLTSGDETRSYSLPGKVRLGNEYGHKVWLDKGDYDHP